MHTAQRALLAQSKACYVTTFARVGRVVGLRPTDSASPASVHLPSVRQVLRAVADQAIDGSHAGCWGRGPERFAPPFHAWHSVIGVWTRAFGPSSFVLRQHTRRKGRR